MKIKNRLLLALAVILLCFTSILVWSLTAYQGISYLYQLAETSQKILRQFYQITIQSGEIYYDLDEYHQVLLETNNLMKKNEEELQEFMVESSDLDLDEELLDKIYRIKTVWDLVSQNIIAIEYWLGLTINSPESYADKDIFNLSRLLITRETISVRQRYNLTQAYLAQQTLVEDMDYLTKLMEDITSRITEESILRQKRAFRLTALILLLFSGILFTIMIRITHSILHRLHMIGVDMAAVASGETIPEMIKGPQDEISSLFRSLMKIMQIIQRKTNELSETNEELNESLYSLQEAQANLVESEKIASLGNLVSGVAHEINTPLGTGITAASYASGKLADLKRDMKTMPEEDIQQEMTNLIDSLNLVQEGLKTSASIVTKFKEISVEQYSLRKKVFNLRHSLDSALVYLEDNLRDKQVKIEIDIPGEYQIEGDPEALTQVFLHMIENSVRHGFISPTQNNLIAIKAEKEETVLTITYRDSGRGIPESEGKRVFEPFYTTDRSSGKGLGLSIVHNLVREVFHGAISYRTEEDKGFFLIELPL